VAEPASEILARGEGAVRILTLNRPDRLNAVSQGLYDRLAAALATADADPDVRCIVLTGAGRAFCAGADLKAHAEGRPDEEARARYTAVAQEVNRRIQTSGTPLVAAVNGHAIGGGLELALSADFMIVASDAKLRLPEIALGTFVGGGVTYTLAERVGVLKARELIYFGDFFSGADAAAMGLANRAVPAEEVLATALAWAERLSKLAPIPLAAAKRLMRTAGTLPRDEALERERRALEEIFGTEDWQEGIDAFHEAREPRYRGA
jgi:enoyl-CoA hydratase